MKFHSTIIFIIIGLLKVSGQSEFAEYSSEYLDKSYKVRISQSEKDKKKNDFTLWIDCGSLDKYYKGSLIVESNKLPEFKEFLNKAKETYYKWDSIAKLNNVTELDKDVDIKNVSLQAIFKGSENFFDFSVLLKASAKIRDGKLRLMLRTNELQSSSNEYITHKGLIMIFSSVSEIEDFISILNEEKAKKHFDSINSKEELFK
jgi:hypothetical protein